MFQTLTAPLLERMRQLEQIDAVDRSDGTPQRARLRQIPADTGKLLALLAAGAPGGQLIEIGTSAGYSALWISLACRERSALLTTFEILPEKARMARETFEAAGVEPLVRIVLGDARDHLASLSEVAFCFLDAEKDVYLDCFELVIPRLVGGGLLIADNVISHREALQDFVRTAEADERVDAMMVPIGNGLMLCRRCMPRTEAVGAPAIEQENA